MKSDVAAVLFEQTQAQPIVYYCKNRPRTAREQEYVDRLLRLAFTVTDVPNCSLQLLHCAIAMCRIKKMIRLKRLQHCIPVPFFVFDDVNGAFHHHLMASPFPGNSGITTAQPRELPGLWGDYSLVSNATTQIVCYFVRHVISPMTFY